MALINATVKRNVVNLTIGVGNSEMRGFGVNATDLPPELEAPFVAVPMAYDINGASSGWTSLGPVGGEHGPEITYCHARYDAGERLRWLKYARNGTSAVEWRDTHAPAAIAWALARQAEVPGDSAFRVAYIAQGHAEANDGTEAAALALPTTLAQVAALLRTGLSAPDLILVVMQCHEFLDTGVYTWRETVQASLTAFVAADSHAYLVDPGANPANAGPDGVHMNSAGQQENGTLAAAAVPPPPLP